MQGSLEQIVAQKSKIMLGENCGAFGMLLLQSKISMRTVKYIKSWTGLYLVISNNLQVQV